MGQKCNILRTVVSVSSTANHSNLFFATKIEKVDGGSEFSKLSRKYLVYFEKGRLAIFWVFSWKGFRHRKVFYLKSKRFA